MNRLGAVHAARVGHGDLDRHLFPAAQRGCRRAQVAVFERRIAQAVSEFIERRAGDVLIFALMGAAALAAVVVDRNLAR